MKIYIEALFIENFVINYIVFYESMVISKKGVNKIRVGVVSLIASVYVCVINYLGYIQVIKMVLNILLFPILVFLLFNDVTFSKYLEHVFNVIYIFSIYAGLNFFLTNIFKISSKGGNKIIIYIVTLVILKYMTYMICKKKEERIIEKNLMFNLKIVHKDIRQNIIAFLDTGNFAKDFDSNMNYIFVDNVENLRNKLDKVGCVKKITNIQTVSGSDDTYTYIIDKVILEKDDKKATFINVPIIITENKFKGKEYNSLIGFSMYMDYLGGIDYE